MKTQQFRWSPKQGWEPSIPDATANFPAQLVLLFGINLSETGPAIQQLRAVYPTAHFLGCSTAGEIWNTQVTDGALVATAIQFEQTQIQSHCIHIGEAESSVQAGARLAGTFKPDGLTHLFVLSDGLRVNGSELIRGLQQQLPDKVTITGGLSGDGPRFQKTVVLSDENLGQDLVAAVGFYGDRLRVGYASLGGWHPFGPKRTITRSKGNVLYELDGQSALDLYKKYLGDYASGLPATGLLFPLSLYWTGDRSVVRTILSINETDQSLTFAGDVPQGSTVQLMQANSDRLVDGAIAAAQSSLAATPNAAPNLAVLISCVGRKLVLKQRVEEEVEVVRDVMGPTTALTGFYSYGEISPAALGKSCELHNQTMTITTFLEQ